MKNNNNLFYTCSLIELIGRITKNTRKDVVEYLGDDLRRIYSHADVFHCEPIEKVADDFIGRNAVKEGVYEIDPKAVVLTTDAYQSIGTYGSKKL